MGTDKRTSWYRSDSGYRSWPGYRLESYVVHVYLLNVSLREKMGLSWP